MKSIVLILLGILSFPAFSQSPMTYTVNVNESSMRWTGYYLFSFGEHTGTIGITKGQLTYTVDQLTGGSFEIDMHSMQDTDMKADDGGNDLTNHLKSDDFFSVDKFPTAYFEITKAEKIKDAQPNQPNYDVTGILTLKGVRNTLSFPVFISIQGNNLTASAKFKFDRTKWNVQYNSGKFFSEIGDGAISDAIGIDLNVKAVKQP
jgi:polyisoprenoid-binding protein YceI